MLSCLAILAIIFLFLVVYFLPWLIAKKRKHKNSDAILLLNLFLGWTLIGWLGSLIWAVIKE